VIRYEGLGLDNIWLQNGYRWVETGHGHALVVDNVEGLERAVGTRLAEQKAPLSGQELRFLRDMLEMSQEALGMRLGRDYQTVARWEAASKKPVPRSADAMLRQLYLEKQGARPLFTAIVDRLAAAARDAVNAAGLSFHEDGDGTWLADRDFPAHAG